MSLYQRLSSRYWACDDGRTVTLFWELDKAKAFADRLDSKYPHPLGSDAYFVGQVDGGTIPLISSNRVVSFPHDREWS